MYSLDYIAEAWSDIEDMLKSKRNFYSVIIGGKPRSNSEKWDAF